MCQPVTVALCLGDQPVARPIRVGEGVHSVAAAVNRAVGSGPISGCKRQTNRCFPALEEAGEEFSRDRWIICQVRVFNKLAAQADGLPAYVVVGPAGQLHETAPFESL